MTRTLRAAVAVVLAGLWVMAVAPAASAGGGGCHGMFSDEATNEIKVAMNCFTPTVARVDVGDEVTWFSGASEAPHTVTAAGEAFSAGSGQLPTGGKQSASFDEPGVYPYACLLHPGMVGAIVVGDGDTDKVSAAPPAPPPAAPAPPANPAPAADAASASLLPAVWGAGLLAVAVGVVVAVRRRDRRAVGPAAPAP